MTRLIALAGVVVLASLPAGSGLEAQTADNRIAQAVSPLPEDLRPGATVVTYDPQTGERQVLRQGTNFIECQPKDSETGFTRCYHKNDGPRRDLEAKLRAQGKSAEEIAAGLSEAIKAGTIPAPRPSMSYRRYDKDDRIQYLWVMRLPNTTPDQIGVSTAPQRDAALKGQGLPWLMMEGTPSAHVMIPINPKPAHSTISDEAADEIAQAVLPLPEDLRAGATVYKYDPKTGERITLRQGINEMECQPRDPETKFTWCWNKATAPQRDRAARLRAEGKSTAEVREALEAMPFGMMSYRLYSDADRIQYLWVMSVPNATAESIGVSEASQRDAALRLEGLPWLMLAGTPGAHIMIPINK